MSKDGTEPNAEAKPHVINPPPISINAAPIGFFMFAEDFWSAAENHTSGMPYPPAKFYLYSHTIELCLKSYIATQGLLSAEIKKEYGHKIEELWEASKAHGIEKLVSLTPEEVEVLKQIDECTSKGHIFRYFNAASALQGYNDYPKQESLSEICKKMIQNLREHCKKDYPPPEGAEAGKGTFNVLF